MSECIFCKIANGEIPSEKLYSDENFIAFKDIRPLYKKHILIVPRKHIASVNEFTDDDEVFFGRIPQYG